MKIWLDDVRAPPDNSWTWCKSYLDAIHTYCLNKITEVSLDHDLGENVRSGYDFACFIENDVHDGRIPPVMHAHSMNPVGRERIQKVIDAIHNFTRGE